MPAEFALFAPRTAQGARKEWKVSHRGEELVTFFPFPSLSSTFLPWGEILGQDPGKYLQHLYYMCSSMFAV
jgi:hypothetical protein